jgi:hypothetical protein
MSVLPAWLTRVVPALAVLAFLNGCELTDVNDTDDSDSSSNNSSTTPSGNTGDDSAQWALIIWRGTSGAGAAQTMKLTSATVDSNHKGVHFSWDSYGFSGDGLGHFFVWNGSNWVGGKFDWIRSPGQAYKLLENVYGGYNGHTVPSSGTKVAFAWTSADGKKRSTLAQTTWP